MKWFSKGPSPYQTLLAMVGIKPGGTVAVLGAGTGRLAAELAAITGLNGRTVVVDGDPAAEARVAAAAAGAGQLVDFERSDWTSLPADLAGLDVAVINCQLAACGPEPAAVIREAVRVIRPGGRIVVIEGRPRKGLVARFAGPAGPVLAGEVVRDLLAAAGLHGSRVLGEEDGVTFIEGVKPRVQEPGGLGARG
jgi:SAM-dependent methyltransferase